MRTTLTAITILIAIAISAPTATANPPAEYEAETVESLLLADNPNERPAFVYRAPASTCVNDQGFTDYGTDCPDINWLCPKGITHGALGRYQRDIPYNKAVLGYQAIDTMCIAGPIIPNPQPATTPTPTPANPQQPAPPQLAFTGPNTNTIILGLALLGAGATTTATARRRQQ